MDISFNLNKSELFTLIKKIIVCFALKPARNRICLLCLSFTVRKIHKGHVLPQTQNAFSKGRKFLCILRVKFTISYKRLIFDSTTVIALLRHST